MILLKGDLMPDYFPSLSLSLSGGFLFELKKSLVLSSSERPIGDAASFGRHEFRAD